MTLPTITRCRSCYAPIVWAKTPLGKPMPIDAEPVTGGNLVLTDGVVRVVASGDDATGPRYVSHFLTCPQSSRWRVTAPKVAP